MGSAKCCPVMGYLVTSLLYLELLFTPFIFTFSQLFSSGWLQTPWDKACILHSITPNDFLVDMSVNVYCLGLTALGMTCILSLTSTTEDPAEAPKVQMTTQTQGFGEPKHREVGVCLELCCGSSLPLPQELRGCSHQTLSQRVRPTRLKTLMQQSSFPLILAFGCASLLGTSKLAFATSVHCITFFSGKTVVTKINI